MQRVIVMIYPARETRPELVDEFARRLRKAATEALRGERDVEHYDATRETGRTREFPRAGEGEMWERDQASPDRAVSSSERV